VGVFVRCAAVAWRAGALDLRGGAGPKWQSRLAEKSLQLELYKSLQRELELEEAQKLRTRGILVQP
jgi:hypothetical protein